MWILKPMHFLGHPGIIRIGANTMDGNDAGRIANMLMSYLLVLSRTWYNLLVRYLR